MTTITDSSLVEMHLAATWESDDTVHEEQYHAAEVNMWRDIFPHALRQKLLGCQPGDKVHHSFPADEILGTCSAQPVSLPLCHWQPPPTSDSPAAPMSGRYYPQGFLQGVSGVFPQTLTPMRVVAVDRDTFTVDRAHPLHGKQLDYTIRVADVSRLQKERGGRCSDRLLEMLENGPGMQARIAGSPLTYDREKAFLRTDHADDRIFYAEPRMVSHIDRQASEHLASVIARFLQPGGRVLDLMASVDSHLPAGHGLNVTGLGMNREEMAANPDLAEYLVHDLNANPRLPCPDKSFDAVLCNLSFEYLAKPEEVVRETARVLKPSGILLVSFSNRWFPPKVTKLWTELHEFERMGLVLQLCSPHYEQFHTVSFRNWPRPAFDKYFPALQASDPLYVVTGRA
ncbi:MAG TPA: methyltransferase type 11 [Desulfobulbaceae bacterium]|nr:methyltransferase type 11 [Desulfobulbaceae bacterium]